MFDATTIGSRTKLCEWLTYENGLAKCIRQGDKPDICRNYPEISADGICEENRKRVLDKLLEDAMAKGLKQ
jgi:hypothetical protein